MAINAITGKITWLPFTAGISFMTDPNWSEEKVEEIFEFKKNSNTITIYAYNIDKNDGYNVHRYMLKNDQFILVSRSKP